jgi:hypothetical protein
MMQQSKVGVLQLVLGVLVATSLVGCSAVLGIDSERTVLKETPLPEQWACLKDPVPTASRTTFTQTLHFTDGATSTFPSIAGLSVRACQRIDFDCTTPLAPAVLTGADGRAVLTVPSGFSGYYEVAGRDDYQSVIMVERVATSDASYEYSLVTKAIAAAYAAAAGAMYLPGMGNMTLIARDCKGAPGVGIAFALNSSGTPASIVYLANSLPTAGTTETDQTGVGVVFALTPGALNATAAASDGSFTLATRAGLVRSGWLTQLSFYPDQLSLTP